MIWISSQFQKSPAQIPISWFSISKRNGSVRSVQKVFSHFEYYGNWMHSTIVTLQPIRGNHFKLAWTIAGVLDYSVSYETLLKHVLSVSVIFIMAEWLNQSVSSFAYNLNTHPQKLLKWLKSPTEVHVILWYMFSKDFIEQNTGKCWICACCLQWKCATNSERIRRSEDTIDLCFGDPDREYLNETCSKIHSMAPVTRTERILCCSCKKDLLETSNSNRFSQGHNWRWVMSLWLWPWKNPSLLNGSCLDQQVQRHHEVRTMLIVFFDHSGGVHMSSPLQARQLIKINTVKLV